MGNNQDPVSLHKYLYANVDPVNNIDPTGNFSLGSIGATLNTVGTLASIASTTYDLYSVATGEKELSASQVGFAVISSLGGGKLMALLGKKVLEKRGILEAVVKCTKKNSFTPDTLVSTNHGFKPIKDIEIGDLVWSYDLQESVFELSKVTHLIHGDGEYDLVTIDLNEGVSFSTTSDHPLLTKDILWRKAGDVLPSDKLLSENGVLEVTDSRRESYAGRVYNLSVSNNHNYLVSEKSVVVHNCPGLPFGALGVKIASQTVWKSRGKAKQRIDVENPNPGQRAGQIHFQDKQTGAKYLYDPETKKFKGAPNSVNKLIRNPEVEAAIKKALRYLGEE